MPVLDFSDVKELEALPADTYVGTISDVEYVKNPKNSGSEPYYKVKFTVGDDEEHDGEYKGRNLWRNYSIKANALWSMKRDMISAGCDPEVFAGKVDLDKEWVDLKGAEVGIVVSVRVHNDKEQNQVDRLIDPTMLD